MDINISIFSDIVCPWCFIGKRRLESALALRRDRYETSIEWLAFELNPQMPKGGLPRGDYLARKFGSVEALHSMDAQVTAAAEGEGIPFDLTRIEMTPNTFDAHRLVWFGKREGRQDRIVELLFSSYFCEGRDIGDRQVLLDLAHEAGLDGIDERELFEGEEIYHAVKEEEGAAAALRVNSVPSFLINEKYLVSGAHPPEALLPLLDQAAGLETG